MGSLVLEAVLSSVLATLGCLLSAPRRSSGRVRRATPASWPARALFPLVPLALVGAGTLAVADASEVVVAVGVLWVATLPWLGKTSRWGVWAHSAWALAVAAGLSYVGAMLWWTLDSGLSGLTLVGAWLLLGLEAAAFLLLLAYGWEVVDVLGSRRWHRRLAPGTTAVAATRTDLPFVSIHVPVHNEPPDLVLDTLRSLAALDYPAYEVLVVDSNTERDALVAPVADFCAEHPDVFRFHRLLDWPGHKAGALNYALTVTDPQALVVGVVDADHQVDADWLLQTVGAFEDPQVAFVQSPRDYRDWEGSGYLRRLYFSYDYFFSVSQPSRDERDAAVFGGTMGLVRLKALRDVGGWDEGCVTEDAELSLRLLAAGYSGHHLDRSFGRGVLPLTFEALKQQRFRACFGGMQILRRHWRTLLPWSRTPLDRSQRLAHLVGGLQWVGDLLSLVFAAVVVVSLLDVALGDGLVLQRLGGLVLVAVPALILFGLLRAVAVVKVVAQRATWRDALGAFVTWLSLGWVVSAAVVRGLTAPEGVFDRTPRATADTSVSGAVRSNRVELASAVVAGVAVLTAVLVRPGAVTLGLAALLVVPIVGWLAAPASTLAAARADLPPGLRARRDSERARARWGRSGGAGGARGSRASRGSLATAAGVAVVLGVVVLVVSPASQQTPRDSALPGVPRTSVRVQPDPALGDGGSTWAPSTGGAGVAGAAATGTPVPGSTSVGPTSASGATGAAGAASTGAATRVSPSTVSRGGSRTTTPPTSPSATQPSGTTSTSASPPGQTKTVPGATNRPTKTKSASPAPSSAPLATSSSSTLSIPLSISASVSVSLPVSLPVP
ncbi:glycosyltransferase family 2 protein [Intrasporangium flavum]|uniref:glycosyltransferase family 2 protein n=1 Tax=Intrasporangium flavum TaxID=1428657 RepID=UPI00096F7AD4|nr:glycosyltransferase family 2 protein [Intrasporangium flavum]